MENISRDTKLELKRKKTTQKQEMGAQGTQALKTPTIIPGSRDTPQQHHQPQHLCPKNS